MVAVLVIKICRSNPVVVNSAGTEVTVRGAEAQLLRVLLLAPEPIVPVAGASAAMRKAPSGFGTYVGNLREAFGERTDRTKVVREGANVWLADSRDDTDAAFIRSNFGKIAAELGLTSASSDWAAHESSDYLYEVREAGEAIDEERALAVLPLVEEIEQMYDGSPALGLHELDWTDFPEDLRPWAQGLVGVASDWMTLWASVQLLAADCRLLRRPDANTALRVFARLLTLARTRDPIEEVWPRLLRAARLTRRRSEQERAWNLTQTFYLADGTDMPDELREYRPPPKTSLSPPLTPHRSRPLDAPLEPAGDAADHLHAIAEILGITPDSTLRLRGEVVDPMTCLQRAQNLLYFSGVLASKWVDTPAIRGAFERLLTRLDDGEGDDTPVKFLIMDPDGDAYSELYQLRGGALSADSIPHLRRLAENHPSFEVRVIDALPSFRILVLDEEWVSFSPYALEAERYATSQYGWQAPHVMLDPRAPYPLAEAFKLYFKERWSNARQL